MTLILTPWLTLNLRTLKAKPPRAPGTPYLFGLLVRLAVLRMLLLLLSHAAGCCWPGTAGSAAVAAAASSLLPAPGLCL